MFDKQMVDQEFEFESFLEIIKGYLSNQEFSLADTLLEKMANTGDATHTATIYFFGGVSKLNQKQYSQAENLFANSLELRLLDNEKHTDLFAISNCYYYLGLTYYKTGKLQKALDACLEALMWENALVNSNDVSKEVLELFARNYYLLAKTSHKQAYLKKTEMYYEESLYYCSSLDLPLFRASVMLSFGILKLNSGKPNKANKLFYRGLWLAKRNRNKKLIAKSVLYIAETYFTNEDSVELSSHRPLAYEMESFQPTDPLVNIVRNCISAYNYHLQKKFRQAKNYWNSILFSDLSALDSRYFHNAFFKYRTFSAFYLWTIHSNTVENTSTEEKRQVDVCLNDWKVYCEKEELTNYLVEVYIIESKWNLLQFDFVTMVENLNKAINIAKINGLLPQENLASNVIKNSAQVQQEIELFAREGLGYPLNYKQSLQQEIIIYFKSFHDVLALSV